MSSHASRRHGFTLIELLVVIAIIAILASILFPVFSRAREKARQSSCSSNMRQVSTAFLMYAQDYDEVPCPTRNEGVRVWTAFLSPYVKNQQVFLCPSAVDTKYGEVWADRGWLSIGMNRNLEDLTTVIARPLADYQEPARTLAFADSTSGDTAGPTNGRGFQIREDRSVGAQSGIAARHVAGTNAAFMDGHVKWYRATTLIPALNSAGVWWYPNAAYGPVP